MARTTLTDNGTTRGDDRRYLLTPSTGAGGVTENAAPASLTLNGTNGYSGTTTVAAGTLRLAGGSALADTDAVNVAAGARDSRRFSERDHRPPERGAGTVAHAALGATLTVSGGGTFTGVLQDARAAYSPWR